jgi:biopolymer transport protein ExbB/TolQ
MLKIFTSGNVFVYFTSVALIAVLAISIERVYTLYFRFRLKVGPFKKALEQALQEMDLNKALRIASLNEAHPVCQSARSGLLKANAGDRELVRAMESTALESMPRITGMTAYLAMLGNIGTLLGLIGTVIGMIEAFEGLGVSDSGAKQEILARGIAIAMQSTALGLIVAIPATFLATVFGSRQERILDQVEEIALTISSYISAANREQARRQRG